MKKFIASLLTFSILISSVPTYASVDFSAPYGWSIGYSDGDSKIMYPDYDRQIARIITNSGQKPSFDLFSASEERLEQYFLDENEQTNRVCLKNYDAVKPYDEIAVYDFVTFTEEYNNTLYRGAYISARLYDYDAERQGNMDVLSYIAVKGDTMYQYTAVIQDDSDVGTSLTSILKSAVYTEDKAGDKISIVVNGHEVHTDSDPVIVSGRTLVPIRAVAEELGYTVGWDGDTRCISMVSPNQNDNVYMFIDDNNVYRDYGGSSKIDVAPQIINSRTYIPLRAAAEAMNCEVEWDAASRTVIIYSKKFN